MQIQHTAQRQFSGLSHDVCAPLHEFVNCTDFFSISLSCMSRFRSCKWLTQLVPCEISILQLPGRFCLDPPPCGLWALPSPHILLSQDQSSSAISGSRHMKQREVSCLPKSLSESRNDSPCELCCKRLCKTFEAYSTA